MNLEEIKPKPVVCRQSTISCALACKRKWWYKYRMGITLRGTQVKESATLGTIYHRLQCLGPGSESKVKAEIVKQQQALMEKVDRGEDLDGQTARLAGMLTDLYNKAVAMARVFWDKYPQPSYFETLGTEVNHTLTPYGLNVEGTTITPGGLKIEGTIDKVLLNNEGRSGPEVWIRDHKSTGRSLAALFGGAAWSLQARIYRWLVLDWIVEYFPEEFREWAVPPIRGFILDGILKPGIKLCKKDEKNAKEWNVPVEDAYLRRVKDWYAENGEDACLSRAVLYTEPLVPDELNDALVVMRELDAYDPAEIQLFVRDVTRRACFAYNSQCPYHDLCSTDPKQWDRLFETKYTIAEIAESEEEHDEEEDG
jgi:hypothetical protein